MHLLKAEVSKVDYLSKAKRPNVRMVGSFFIHLLNFRPVFSYRFKNLYGHLPLNWNPKIIPFYYCRGLFETSFKVSVELLSQSAC